MSEPKDVAPLSTRQKRKHRRFSLQYPVRVTVHAVGMVVELEAVSSNISIGGLLLETSFPIPQHTPVSFIVTALSAQFLRPIHFVGEGKVVRVDPQVTDEGFAVAVECARPIAQIDHYLEATGS
jgi:hypothetical protein